MCYIPCQFYISSRLRGVIIDGVWAGEWIFDHLYTRLGTTSIYKAIAHLHASEFSRTHVKSSQFAFTSRFLATDRNNRDSSASVLTSLLTGEYATTELSAQL
jgi:hypothetical protein